jgi:hypothetical protein
MSDTCVWGQDDDGNWDTSCGNTFVFIDGDPAENRFAYCPYCGGNLLGNAAIRADDPRVDMMREGREKHGSKYIENAPPKPDIIPPSQPKRDNPYFGREK